MALLISLSKKTILVYQAIWSFFLQSKIALFLRRWSEHWARNSRQIIMWACINACITFTTEFIARSSFSPFLKKNSSYSFFVKDAAAGSVTIHRQSLTNITMTFFASLVGGPVYFFTRRLGRFFFFVIFGVLNSMLGQSISSAILDGSSSIDNKRLIFDLFYNGTFKFIMFEFLRKTIVNLKFKMFRVLLVRTKQDLITTFFKVTTLNLLGFKG